MPFLLPSVFAFFRMADVWPVTVPCVLGMVAIFLLLPKTGGGRTTVLGALLGVAALLVGAFLLLRTGVVSPETVLFYIFSGLAIVSGILLVTQRNPARAALAFALVVLSTCGLFLLLAAPFLMAATIIIYAGAIIVTFLFVLMLASQAGITDADARTREPLLATALGFLLLGCLVYVLQMSYENNEGVRELDKLIALTERARKDINQENLEQYRRFPEDLKALLDKSIKEGTDKRPVSQTQQLNALVDKVMDEAHDWPSGGTAGAEELRQRTERLRQGLLRLRQQYAWLPPLTDDKPTTDPAEKLHLGLASNLSGPSAIEPAGELRYDGEGRPYLPADNSEFLGRSLFTDFLLPVELAGLLLLVATIGAIAIAHRRAITARAT